MCRFLCLFKAGSVGGKCGTVMMCACACVCVCVCVCLLFFFYFLLNVTVNLPV